MATTTAQRFPIRFSRLNAIVLGVLGLTRSRSYVDADGFIAAVSPTPNPAGAASAATGQTTGA
ncbi:MAG: hypothetical protein ACRDJE_00445 [Dehalococcoidia bacterium]